jgi:Ca-activated chloride channel family protein
VVNHATARALKGERDEGARELERMAGRAGTAGNAARYNLGTMLGQDGEIDRGIETLRKALERSPGDDDARWNYEVLLRRKQAPEPKPSESQPKPSPSQPAPQGGSPQPNPGMSPPNTPPPPPGGSQAQPPPRGAGGMSKGQADQLLGALQEAERLERLRQQRLRVRREKRGEDW